MLGLATCGNKGLNLQRNDVVRRPASPDARFLAERRVRRWVLAQLRLQQKAPARKTVSVMPFEFEVGLHGGLRGGCLVRPIQAAVASGPCGSDRTPAAQCLMVRSEVTHSQSLRPSSDGSADMGRAQKYRCACVNACKRETLRFVAQDPCARGCPFICNCPRHRSRRMGHGKNGC